MKKDSQKKIMLVIDACIRGAESRTLAIGKRVVEFLEQKYEAQWLNLYEMKPQPIDMCSFTERGKGTFADGSDEWAKQFAAADLIVIIAPFWDMSFPAVLKSYFEKISISGITFVDGPDSTIGNCKADRMIYITTRGMEIGDDDPRQQASGYLSAIGWLWGISKVDTVSAIGMDYVTAEERLRRIDAAAAYGIKLCEELVND